MAKKKFRPIRQRAAYLMGVAFEVLCPYCLEVQPNPDDSGHLWLLEEVKRAGIRKCVSCEESFAVITHDKVKVDWE